MITETLNDRLDRIELQIKLLSDKINQIKPNITKEDVRAMISDSINKIKPQERDISKEINHAIKCGVTKEFITELYRSK